MQTGIWEHARRAATAFVVVLLVVILGVAPASGAPTTPPPNGALVLAPGHLPTPCTEGQPTSGYYWSEFSQRWVSAPHCWGAWQFLSLSPSQIVEPGGTVTMTAMPWDPAMGGWIAIQGGMGWSYPGTLVSGCTTFDLTCTVTVGDAGNPPAEWQWAQFHVTGPGRVFILPPSYYPRCQAEMPCLDTYTNAWSYVGIRPNWPGPEADFDASVDGGQVNVTATTHDPADRPMTHTWAFQGGPSASGDTASHTYTSGSIVDITLTSTADDGRTDTITKQIELELPLAEITITPERLPIPPSKQTSIDVTVHSLDTLNPITFEFDDPLSASEGLLTVTPAPGSDTEFTLAPGGSRTFTFDVTSGAELGVEQLHSQGTATASTGREDTSSTSLAVEVAELIIDAVATFDPEQITLDETDDGPTPDTVNLHLAMKNVTETEVTDLVVLLGNPGFQHPSGDILVFPSDVVRLSEPAPDGGHPVGTIAPGETAELDIAVTVLDDGEIEWGGLVQFMQEGSQHVDRIEPGKLDSEPEFLARFELIEWPDTGEIVDATIDDLPGDVTPNASQVVNAGQSFALLGEVENLTTDQVVMVDAPTVNLENVTSAVFRGTDSAATAGAPTLATELTAGAFYREAIKPGITEVVSAYPSTMENETFGPGEAFSSRLTVEPAAASPNEDGSYPDAQTAKVFTPTALTASAATLAPGPLPGPNEGESYLGRFAIGYVEGGMKFVKGTADATVFIVSKIPEIPSMTAEAATALAGLTARMAKALEGAKVQWDAMTVGERIVFIEEVAGDIWNFITVKTPDASLTLLTAIKGFIDQAATQLFYTGFTDPGAFWQNLGSFTAQTIGDVSVGIITDAFVAKLLARWKVGNGFELADQFLAEQAAAQGFKLEKGLFGIKPGTYITDLMLAMGMGITKGQKDQMLAVAKKWGVNIYARSRGAGSIKLIEDGISTMKPYFIKPKSVNDIDQLFLGFDGVPKEVVAMKAPPPWPTVEAKMAGHDLTDDQKKLVLERWKTRNKEWWGEDGDVTATDPAKVASGNNVDGSFRKELEGKSGKTLDLTLETDGNFEHTFRKENEVAFMTKPTKFRLQPSATDPNVLVPELFENGTWKSIVGDIDLVAITYPDGRIPDPELMLKIYQDLQKGPVNMQHSATLTWTSNKAEKFLNDHIGDQSEPLVEFSRAAIRAVRFDPGISMTWDWRQVTGAQFIHMAGGQIYTLRNWATGAAVTTTVANNRYRNYSPPSVWPVEGGVDMSRTAPPMRHGENGPEAVPGGGGQPAQRFIESTRLIEAEPGLVIGVQTAVAELVPTGTTTLPILSLATLYPDGTDGQGWFAVGDEVIVDAGQAGAFRTRIVAITDTTVTLADPLPAEVWPGAMLAMVPEQVVTPTTTTTTPSPVTTAPVTTAPAPVTTTTPAAQPPATTLVPGGRLPRTGSDSTEATLTIALMLLMIGALAVSVQRRARRP